MLATVPKTFTGEVPAIGVRHSCKRRCRTFSKPVKLELTRSVQIIKSSYSLTIGRKAHNPSCRTRLQPVAEKLLASVGVRPQRQEPLPVLGAGGHISATCGLFLGER